ALCFPTSHPNNVTEISTGHDADLVVALEVRDLESVPVTSNRPTYQVSSAGLAVKAWAADLQRVQQSERLLASDVYAFLASLIPAVKKKLANSVSAKERAEHRNEILAELTRSKREEWYKTAANGE